MLCIWTPS